MSRQEIHKGIITPIKRLENEEDINYLNRALKLNLEEIEEDGISEYFYEKELYEKWICVSNTIYKIDSEELYEEELYNFTKKRNGQIDFQANFYNAGTCLSEILEEIIEKANKK